MAYGRMTCRKSEQRISRPAIVLFLVLLFHCSNSSAVTDLVITADDFPFEVGRKASWSFTSADGKITGTMNSAIVSEMKLGDTSLFKELFAASGQPWGESYWAKGPDGLASYPGFGDFPPVYSIPFPLKRGATHKLRTGDKTVKATVEGPEQVSVPLGRFRCLVLVLERELNGVPWKQRMWVAPRVGIVKMTWPADQEFTFSLASVEKGGLLRKDLPPGDVLVSDFEGNDLLLSPLFPKGRWQGKAGTLESVSRCELEPGDGAEGTSFSMKWAYHIRGTWATAELLPSGSWGESVDLSGYDSVSFWIKGLAARWCGFQLQSAPQTPSGLTLAQVGVQLTPQWQRIEIPLKTHADLKAIDLTKVFNIGFTDFDAGFGANVVWVDEIMFHTRSQTK